MDPLASAVLRCGRNAIRLLSRSDRDLRQIGLNFTIWRSQKTDGRSSAVQASSCNSYANMALWYAHVITPFRPGLDAAEGGRAPNRSVLRTPAP